METPVFTPLQQQILQLFKYENSEETLTDIKNLIVQYYQQKLDEEMDRLWDAGILDQKKLDELYHAHLRTPYVTHQ